MYEASPPPPPPQTTRLACARTYTPTHTPWGGGGVTQYQDGWYWIEKLPVQNGVLAPDKGMGADKQRGAPNQGLGGDWVGALARLFRMDTMNILSRGSQSAASYYNVSQRWPMPQTKEWTY